MFHKTVKTSCNIISKKNAASSLNKNVRASWQCKPVMFISWNGPMPVKVYPGQQDS